MGRADGRPDGIRSEDADSSTSKYTITIRSLRHHPQRVVVGVLSNFPVDFIVGLGSGVRRTQQDTAAAQPSRPTNARTK